MTPIALNDLNEIARLMEAVMNKGATPQLEESVGIASNLLVKALTPKNGTLRAKLEAIVTTFKELASQDQTPELQALANKLEQVVLVALSPDSQKKKLPKRLQNTTPGPSKPAP